MKNYAFTLLGFLILLAACSKDDTPLPEPFKVTQITCIKNGSSADGFSLNIQYNVQGNVSAITDKNENVVYNYQYNDNKIYVVSNVDQLTNTEYTLSNNRITNQIKYAYDPNNAGEQFIWDKYKYDYSGHNWTNTEMEGNRFSGEKIISYPATKSNKFEWKYGNIQSYTSGEYYVMEFEYGNKIHPTNYPFRILNSLPSEFAGSLVKTDNFSPLNLMKGNNNNYLLEKAHWYMIPNVDRVLGEYDFNYKTNEEGYVTEVTITESINESNETSSFNTYKISFDYTYNPNK